MPNKVHIPWYKSYGFSLMVAITVSFAIIGALIIGMVLMNDFVTNYAKSIWGVLLSFAIFLVLLALAVWTCQNLHDWCDNVQWREIKAGKDAKWHLACIDAMAERRKELKRKGYPFVPKGLNELRKELNLHEEFK